MSNTFLAVVLALFAAVFTAVFSLIVRRGKEHGNAVAGVIIGLITNLPILLAATVIYWEPGWWNLRAIIIFSLVGVVTTGLGRLLLYTSIHVQGIARTSPLLSALPLFTAGLAYGILGERPGPFIWAGTVLIVAGSLAVAKKEGGAGGLNWNLLWMPVCALVSFALGNILRKAGLNELPSPLMGGTVTYIAGISSLLLLARFLPEPQRPNLRWGRAWYFYGGCGFINILAFLARYTATLLGDLTLITPLFATQSLFALFFSAIFLRDIEQISRWVVGGAFMIFLGALLITWRVF